MKMKLYLAMAAAAFLMTNCSQDENLIQTKGSTNTLTATIEGTTRSSVTDGGVFSWDENDAIAVGNQNGGFTKFVCGTEGSFSAETSIVPTSYAIYPYNEAYTSLPEGLPTITLASNYEYGSTNAPMLATITEGATSLTFNHLSGLMRFKVKNVPTGATTFTLTADKGITGEFTPTTANGETSISALTAGNDNQSVSITFNEVEEVMDFYIPMPVGEYESLTVSITGSNLSGYTLTSTQGVTNTITRGKLLLMPTLVCDDNGSLTKEEGSIVSLSANEEVSLEVNNGDEVVVDVQDNAEATLNLTAPDGTTDGTLIISDGSEDNTESSETSNGTLNVKADNVSTLIINAPTLTVNLTSGSYDVVETLTAQNTLVINNGVSVGTLKLKGGHIRLGGSITTAINREGEGTDIIYIILEKDVEAPTVTLPDNVKVVTVAEWDLIKAIEKGGNYTLTSDVATSELLKVEKDLILDLGGHTLAFTPQTGYPGIKNTANLEVKNGTITSTQVGIQNNGTLTINCNIESLENAINNVYDGETTINGGTYKNTSTEKALINSNNYGNGTPVLTINGGTFESVFTNVSYNNSSTGAVNAGTFKCTGGWHNIYVGGETGNCNVTYDAEKCSFESNGINIQVNNWGVETNKNTLNNTEYTGVHNIQFVSTFDELKSAITAGSSVVLTANISDVSELLKIEKNLSLDLGGHTLAFTPQTGYPGIKNTANLEVKNGTITSTQVGIQNNGTLTINCNIESLENAINNVYDGETTINGGTYKNTSTEKALINSNNYGDGTPVLTINGGTFESVFTNVSYNNSSTGAVNAGTFKCTGEWHNIYVGGETGSCNVTYKAEGCSFKSNGINIIVSDWGTGNTNTVNNTNYTTTTTLLDLENE